VCVCVCVCVCVVLGVRISAYSILGGREEDSHDTVESLWEPTLCPY